MAYCTPEDGQYLVERGFGLTKDGQAFRRETDEYVDMIMPGWPNKKLGDLNVPAPELVFWMVGRWCLDESKNLQLVVSQEDYQPTPTSAYVTAEIRGWKRQL